MTRNDIKLQALIQYTTSVKAHLTRIRIGSVIRIAIKI